MSREVLVSWDDAEADLRHKARITSLDQLDFALDEIELSAMQAGCIYQVDLWLAELKVGDPLMIQFPIGHPERSSLLWHEDGSTTFAVQNEVYPPTESLTCRRFGETEEIEPQFAMVDPVAVRSILALYLMLDQRPDIVNWIEAQQD